MSIKSAFGAVWQRFSTGRVRNWWNEQTRVFSDPPPAFEGEKAEGELAQMRSFVPIEERPVVGILPGCSPYGCGESDGIWDAGGLPRSLNPSILDREDPLEGIDALVIRGGSDVNPELYGARPGRFKGLHCAPMEQDLYEIAVIKLALERGMPILGICRGEQILNVAAGGTLFQDIPTDLKRPRNFRVEHRGSVHKIVITPGSRLEEILGSDLAMVNSLHHQAVAAVAPGFVAVAFGPDGIVEAIQNVKNSTQMGVQFHPEMLQHIPPFQRFFEVLVGDASRFRGEKAGVPARKEQG